MFLIGSCMLHRACTSDLDARQHPVLLDENMDHGLGALFLRRCLQYLRPLWHRQPKRCRLDNVGMDNQRMMFSTVHCGAEGRPCCTPFANITRGVRLDLV